MPLLLAAIALLFHSTFFPHPPMLAHGGDEESSVPVVINEIEIKTAEDDGLAWIELLNAGDTPVSLSKLGLTVIIGDSKMTHTSLTPDDGDPTNVLPAQGRRTLSLPINLDNNSNLVSLQLFEDGLLLDEVDGLTDNIGDGHTWQRYPDGRDTGHFEDWVFAESTKGEDNGNLGKAIAQCYLDPFCMNLDIPMHKSHVLNVNKTAYIIDTFSTSSVTGMNLDREGRKLVVELANSSRESELLFIHLTFPKILLSGNFLVSMDQGKSQQPFLTVTNDTHSRLIIEYESGTGTIEIVGTNVVPEFRSASMLLAVAAITFALILGWTRFSVTTRTRLGSP